MKPAKVVLCFAILVSNFIFIMMFTDWLLEAIRRVLID